jgi:hypothetical protein
LSSFNLGHVLKTLPFCFFDWKVKTLREDQVGQLDCLAAFAFGEISDGIDSNYDIAVIANRIDKPCISQKEVAHYLLEIEGNNCIPIPDELYATLAFSDPRGPNYVNSYQVALAIAKICYQNGWRSIGVLTVEPHQILCIKILRKMGYTAYAIDCSAVRYSPDNNQPWVGNKAKFTFYSVPTRLFFLLKGWI